MSKEKELTFFDFASAIQSKSNLEYDDKAANGYMLMLHFSHDNNCLEIVNELNERIFTSTIPNKAVYQYLYNKIPRGKRFIRWIKKDKSKDTKVESLMKKYNCSKREAHECLY